MPIQPPSPPYVGPLPHTGGGGNKPLKRIVIHCTAGAEPGTQRAARTTAEWTKRSGVVSSYHYVADAKESVQAVFDSVIAFHCGTNSNSIGYELSCSLTDSGKGHWENDAHQDMLRIAAKDVARLCLAYDVPMVKLSVSDLRAGKKGICGHVDMRDAFGNTTHWDPGPFFPWQQFIGLVRDEADRLTEPKPDPEPVPEPQPSVPEYPFTVATYNAGDSKHLGAELAKLLEQADAVLLQEVGDRGPELARVPGAQVIREEGDGRGKTAILLREGIEVVESGYWPLTGRVNVGSFGAGPPTLGPKWVAWVKVKHPESGRAVNLGSTHLPPSVQKLPFPGRGKRRAMWTQQASGIVGWFKDREGDGVTILGGDFNATAGYTGLKALKDAGLVGVTTSSHGKRAIDWQWFRRAHVRVDDVKALGGFTSDHRPVVVRYLITEKDSDA